MKLTDLHEALVTIGRPDKTCPRCGKPLNGDYFEAPKKWGVNPDTLDHFNDSLWTIIHTACATYEEKKWAARAEEVAAAHERAYLGVGTLPN